MVKNPGNTRATPKWEHKKEFFVPGYFLVPAARVKNIYNSVGDCKTGKEWLNVVDQGSKVDKKKLDHFLPKDFFWESPNLGFLVFPRKKCCEGELFIEYSEEIATCANQFCPIQEYVIIESPLQLTKHVKNRAFDNEKKRIL